MSSNLENYKKDLSRLIKIGEGMQLDLLIMAKEETGKLNEELKKLTETVKGSFEKDYQRWYTESHAVIRQLIPDRLEELEILYKGEARRKEINSMTYTVQDWLTGVRSDTNYLGKKIFNDFAIVSMKFNAQLEILKAAASRFESTLYDLRQIVQADLFDSELEAARELLKNGFLRGAGAIAGVVMERHLAQVCSRHSIKSTKKNPSISDLNDLLKKNNVIEVPNWRFIRVNPIVS